MTALTRMMRQDLVTCERLLLPPFTDRDIQAYLLRLDRLHPVVSGNKWFKLKYFLEDALRKNYRSLLSFGGAYSNHVVALAFAAREIGLESVGIIRGERPPALSHTLKTAELYGMHLRFIGRKLYAGKNSARFLQDLADEFPGCYLIPEGGAGDPGILGSEEILSLPGSGSHEFVFCAVGTGTMFRGLVRAAKAGLQVIGIPVWKGLAEDSDLGKIFPVNPRDLANGALYNGYHFGGYARKTRELLDFMNSLYRNTGVPTDFVYTAKLLYGVIDLANRGLVPAGSRILIIHSGGLQGNLSLPPHALAF